jgi:oxygen-independent coproporphyrinogen-3 oxidase
MKLPKHGEKKNIPQEMLDFGFWKEYPERDREYVRWYPCNIKSLSGKEIWEQVYEHDEPLSFYLHIPFCNNKCHSCFYTKYNTQPSLTERYLDAIKKEITMYANQPYIRQKTFHSGYFGGGTPTALSEKQLYDLLTHVNKSLNIEKDAGITMETTPREVTKGKIKIMLENGIKRISIGIQSLDDELLTRIGRNHTAKEAKDAVCVLREEGVKAINVDLMYGLPGETMESWKSTIKQLMEMQVDSVSLYSFVVIPFSKIFMKIMNGQLPECPKEETCMEFYNYAVKTLLENNYKATSTQDFVNCNIETSEYVELGESYSLGENNYEGVFAPSMSQLAYPTDRWYYCRDQIPFGSGAYGYVNTYTCLNEPDILKYIETVNKGEYPVVMGSKVNNEERKAMLMVLGTKMLKVKKQDYYDRTKVSMEEAYGDIIRKLEEQGLVHLTEDALEVTYPKGWYYSDNISKAFYSKDNYRIPQPAVDNITILKYLKENKV